VTSPGDLKVGLIFMPKNFRISTFSNIPEDAGEDGALDPVILLEKGVSCPKCFNVV
jgi:hypothetical protein